MQNLQTTNSQKLALLKQQPAEYLKNLYPVTFKDCQAEPTLAALENNGVDTLKIIVLVIIEMVEAFNFGKIMNVSQVESLSKEWLKKYWTYTPADFKLLARRVKELRYIKVFYESIDETKLNYCIQEFDKEREAEKRIDREVGITESRVDAEKTIINLLANAPDEISLNLQKLADGITKKAINYTSKPRERTDQEKVLDGFIAEFDALFSQQDKGSGGQRFVEYKSKMYNIDTFCNLRYAEERK